MEKVPQGVQRMENVSEGVQKVEEVPQVIQRMEEVPQDLQWIEKVPQVVQKMEEVPHVVQKMEEVPHVVQKMEEVPHVVQKMEEVHQVVQKMEEVPHVVQKMEEVPHVVQKMEEVHQVVQKMEEVHHVVQKMEEIPQVVQSMDEVVPSSDVLGEEDQKTFDKFNPRWMSSRRIKRQERAKEKSAKRLAEKEALLAMCRKDPSDVLLTNSTVMMETDNTRELHPPSRQAQNIPRGKKWFPYRSALPFRVREQVSSDLQVVVMRDEHGAPITNADEKLIRKSILYEIMKMLEDPSSAPVAPRFAYSGRTDCGWFLMTCQDQETLDWLLKWTPPPNLIMVKSESAPWHVLVTVAIRDNKPVEERTALSLLKFQNPKIVNDDWQYVRMKRKGIEWRLDFLAPRSVYQTLKEAHWNLAYELSQVPVMTEWVMPQSRPVKEQ